MSIGEQGILCLTLANNDEKFQPYHAAAAAEVISEVVTAT